MRIHIRCTEDGCGANFSGDEQIIIAQYRAHMEEHQLRIREANQKALKIKESSRPKSPAKRKRAVSVPAA